MATRKSNGRKVIHHTIEKGETLSTISKLYFESENHWIAIHKYNQYLGTLGSNPSEIKEGAVISIPRDEAGYRWLIRYLEMLMENLRADCDAIGYQLDKENYVHQGNRILIELAADIGTALGGILASYDKAYTLARKAELAKGAEKIELNRLADFAARDFSDQLKRVGINKLIDLLAQGHKDAPGLIKDARTVKKALNIPLKLSQASLGISEILLDYAKPTEIADIIIRIAVGETPQQTYQNQKVYIERTVERQTAQLLIKKLRIDNEFKVVWGG